MHWCPECNKPCFCDCDDTDYGTFIPDGCDHECQEEDFDDNNEENEEF